MELRVLKYFLAVAKEKNISRAAESLHLTQPTLSRQIAELESELGKKLFSRGKQMNLTDEGMILKNRAEEVVALIEKIQQDFNHGGEVTGNISIGAGVYSSSSQLIRSLEKFSELYPKVHYEIYTNSSDYLLKKINQGLLDFALLQEPIDISNYEFLRLKTKDTWGLFMRSDSPLAEKNFITRQDLIGRRLCTARRLNVRREIDYWLGDTHDLNIFSTLNLIDNIIPLIADGFVEVITPNGAVENYDARKFIFKPLSPTLETSTVLVWKKFLPMFSAARIFLDFIKNAEL